MKNPYTLVLAGFLALVAQAPAFASALVDAAWLAKSLGSEQVLVLDASPGPLHAKGHIPGAVPVDVMALASFGVRDTPAAHIEGVYQALGIDPDRKVVIYDQGGSWFATRVFFQLHYDGFPTANLAILDGGFAKWQAQGLPVTRDATAAPKRGTFRITKAREQDRTRMAELVAASGDRANHVLLDALGPEYHYGAAAFFDKAGHIPNAVLMPAEDFFNADKTFKRPGEIRRMLAHYSIGPEQVVHAHCGGGGAASVPYFALRHLAGHDRVKLSVESQMGWLQDERGLPFWTYGAPSMMREAAWLQAWGGRMARMYGIGKVSVVDVRDAAAYAQGHLPFAVNVPVAAFRDHAKDASRLAELLGAAGVDPAHEAIVVSGRGVTKEAALAYVMLEKLGQRKVSILLDSLESVDSLDQLARMGFGVTKEPTTVGAPKKPGELAVPPAQYAARPREGVTLPAAGGRDVPARVFVASGATVPAGRVDGKVVHVPYTELLQPDGRPKAARDIWAVLGKAGVPRYAELVTFSDDPGEAAVNYYLLKLMGFPDIKALL